MAEEAAAPVAVDATKAVDEPTRPVDTAEPAKAAEGKPSDGGDVPADAPAEEQAPATAAAADDQAAKDDATDAKPDTTVTEGSGNTAPAAEAASTNGTPASAKKANNNRRKSTGAVPEHKSKKTPSKKKKAPELHLDTQPGDMWLVAMRGYQPWPVIICDEDMLPETLLAKRPVSAVRIDGTYREDYQEGGKNAKDRRYPVMFLGTNEFAWHVNTELLPFDVEEIKKEVETGNSAKKNKALWEAYLVAAEGHDLPYFKELLANHEEAVQQDELVKEAKREEKAKKAAKRKSTAGADPEDVEMEDVDDNATASAKKAKSSKKRKKETESEGEDEKPAKNQKTTLKLTTKKKPAAEPKKSKSSKKEEIDTAQPEEPPVSEEEQLKKRENLVLYLRHRLQKGFLTRNQAPKDEDMPAMSGYITQLEALKDLEPEIIRKTKVHKVLKGINKLSSVPRDEEFQITQRASELLAKWSSAMASENDPADENLAPTTNGVTAPEKTDGATAAPEAAKPSEANGDATTTNTKDEAPATKTDSAKDAVDTAT